MVLPRITTPVSVPTMVVTITIRIVVAVIATTVPLIAFLVSNIGSEIRFHFLCGTSTTPMFVVSVPIRVVAIRMAVIVAVIMAIVPVVSVLVIGNFNVGAEIGIGFVFNSSGQSHETNQYNLLTKIRLCFFIKMNQLE